MEHRGKVNNLCCILKPYSRCHYCKGKACQDCDVWIADTCPTRDNKRHMLMYLPEAEQR